MRNISERKSIIKDVKFSIVITLKKIKKITFHGEGYYSFDLFIDNKFMFHLVNWSADNISDLKFAIKEHILTKEMLRKLKL